jgi:hypothetical protein
MMSEVGDVRALKAKSQEKKNGAEAMCNKQCSGRQMLV